MRLALGFASAVALFLLCLDPAHAQPSFQVAVTAGPTDVLVKQTETLTATATANITASDYNMVFTVTLNGAQVASDRIDSLNFTANTPVKKTWNWTIPAKAKTGAYEVTVEIKKNNTSYGSGTAVFSVVAALPVNGACGSSNSSHVTSAPTANLCSTGTASAVTGSGPFDWTCAGLNGGTTASCAAQLEIIGSCGAANGTDVTSTPTTGLCSVGTASSVTGSGLFDWTCAGSNGGTTASCSAQLEINGACGSANGSTVTSAPTTNLCSIGTASSVTGSGPFSWSCAGSNDGSTASCSAQYTVTIYLATPSSLSGTPGGTITYKTNWSGGPTGTTSYEIFTHFTDTSGNILFQDPDHYPNPLTTAWTGGPYTETRTVTIPSTLAAGTYYVMAGLYTGATRLTLNPGPGVTPDNQTRYQIATLTVSTNAGQCGSSNYLVTNTQPTTNLCSGGTASALTGTGPWYWTCSGTSTTASCQTLVPAFYVAINGTDSNAGTSTTAPFATLGKCQIAMQGSSSIKTCYIREGTYSISSTLSLTSSDNGETWSGYPADPAQSAMLQYDLTSPAEMIALNGPGPANITLRNFTFDGGTSGGASQGDGAIHIGSVNNIHVENNKFQNNSNQCDIYVYNSDDIYFRGNTAGPNEFQWVTVHTTDGNNHNGIYITDNNMSAFSRFGVEIQSNSGTTGGIHLDRNIIANSSGQGIGASIVPSESTTCNTIWGNTFTTTTPNAAQWGIEAAFSGPASTDIEQNTITNVGAPFFISNAVATTIQNNTITGFGDSYGNGAFNQDGGYAATEWIGTNSINGVNITGVNSSVASPWPGSPAWPTTYGTKPTSCAPSNVFPPG